jgi:ribonuclease BN (tRNA processing enzyme)
MPDHNPTAFGPGPDGLGEYHAAALELAADVDVLVHDAQLLPQELAAEAHYGHAAADYAVALAERANARAVALFHHRLDRTDDELDALAERLAGRSPAVSVATEGVVLEL